jgi:small subunit ribosomal protein S13e
MHSGGKGISKSSIPYKRTPAQWVKAKSVDVEDMVVKFAKKGLTPSQVNTFFRFI